MLARKRKDAPVRSGYGPKPRTSRRVPSKRVSNVARESKVTVVKKNNVRTGAPKRDSLIKRRIKGVGRILYLGLSEVVLLCLFAALILVLIAIPFKLDLRKNGEVNDGTLVLGRNWPILQEGHLYPRYLGKVFNIESVQLVLSDPRPGQSQLIQKEMSSPSNDVGESVFGAKRYLEANPWISRVDLSWKLFPLRAVLEASFMEADMVVSLSGNSWLASDEGFLLQPLGSVTDTDLIMKSSELPRLQFEDPNSKKTDAKTNPDFTAYRDSVWQLRLLSAVGGLPFSVEKYKYKEDTSLDIYPQNPLKNPQVTLRIASAIQAQQAKGRLEQVLADAKVRLETPKRVDLRFSNRAVVGFSYE